MYGFLEVTVVIIGCLMSHAFCFNFNGVARNKAPECKANSHYINQVRYVTRVYFHLCVTKRDFHIPKHNIFLPIFRIPWGIELLCIVLTQSAFSLGTTSLKFYGLLINKARFGTITTVCV